MVNFIWTFSALRTAFNYQADLPYDMDAHAEVNLLVGLKILTLPFVTVQKLSELLDECTEVETGIEVCSTLIMAVFNPLFS